MKTAQLFTVFLLAFCGNAQAEMTFRRSANAAQYKETDYSNAVRVERGISLEQAFQIAEEDPNIDYFVYTKGYQMVLEIPPGIPFDVSKDPLHLVTLNDYRYDDGRYSHGHCRIFRHGDVVFFTDLKSMWLGSAPGLADTYIKVKE